MMITSLSIALLSCLIMILCVLFKPTFRFGKITLDSYWVVIFLGACAMMLSGQIDFGSLGKALTDASAVNPVKILILFISMTVLSVFLDEVGFFGYLAVKALSLAGKSQVKLFTVLYLTVSVLTVFTSNDIIVLTFTPFICYFAKRADIDPKPYLFAEFIAANTMSMMLIIGNPTNIYIATSYSIAFIDYFLVMALPTLASSVTAYIILLLLFRKSLACPMDAKPQTAHIENKLFLGIGVAILSLCTVILAVGPYFGLEMWYVSFFSALLLFILIGTLSLIRKQKTPLLKNTLKRAPWQLIPFVLSMFVLILAISEQGVTEEIGKLLGEDHTVFRYGIVSFLAANVINNIPMSVLFCPVIAPLSGQTAVRAVYATVVGSNLGAYLTPIGALAGIMWMSLLKRQNVRITYRSFLKHCAVVAVPALFVNLLTLYVLLA